MPKTKTGQQNQAWSLSYIWNFCSSSLKMNRKMAKIHNPLAFLSKVLQKGLNIHSLWGSMYGSWLCYLEYCWDPGLPPWGMLFLSQPSIPALHWWSKSCLWCLMCVHLHSLPDRKSKGYIYIRGLKKALTYSAYIPTLPDMVRIFCSPVRVAKSPG